MKQFLEEYGAVIVVVAVILTIVLMVSPVGTYIKDGISNFISQFSQKAQDVNLSTPTAESLFHVAIRHCH